MVMFANKFVCVLCRSSDALLHNTKVKRKELLAQVAKRAERAQLLVCIIVPQYVIRIVCIYGMFSPF